jgi:hypothetical protein
MHPGERTAETVGDGTADAVQASDLYPARAGRDPVRGLWVAVAALVLLFQSAFFAWFPGLRSPNELTRVYLASALVEDGSVQIDRQLARHGRIFDVSVREVDGQQHYYCDKAPGVSFLSVPLLYAYEKLSPAPSLAGKVRLTRLAVSTLPTLLLLALFARFSARHLRSARLAALIALLYGLGSVATAYASLAFGHQASAVLLFAVFVLIAELPLAPRSVPPARAAAIGALAALAVLVEYQNSLLLVPFGLFFVVRVRARTVALLSAALGALPFAVLLLSYHQRAFGSPFATGYSFLASSFKEVHAQGMLGVALPQAGHAYLSFLSPAKGLFFFSPWLALGVPGVWLAFRRGAPELRVLAVFVVAYGLFVSALVYPVGGWTVSQRHLVPSVPFMLVPVGLCVERLGRAGRVLLTGLGLPALLFCGLSACVWPHYQESLANPFWQLGWPLYRAGFVAPTPLSGVVPSGLVAALLLALGAGLLVRELVRAPGTLRVRAGALASALALSLGVLTLSRLPGRAQDVEGDLRFAREMYRHVGE